MFKNRNIFNFNFTEKIENLTTLLLLLHHKSRIGEHALAEHKRRKQLSAKQYECVFLCVYNVLRACHASKLHNFFYRKSINKKYKNISIEILNSVNAMKYPRRHMNSKKHMQRLREEYGVVRETVAFFPFSTCAAAIDLFVPKWHCLTSKLVEGERQLLSLECDNTVCWNAVFSHVDCTAPLAYSPA